MPVLRQIGPTKEEKQILEEWIEKKYEENNGEVPKEKLRNYLKNSPELINLLLGYTRR